MTKTVKVRIAVAVDPSGAWNAYGGPSMKDADAMDFAVEVLADGEARYWLTAELPVPEHTEVAATVEPDARPKRSDQSEPQTLRFEPTRIKSADT